MRLAVGGIFVYHGWGKLANIAGTTGFFEANGLPIAGFLAYFVGVVELVAGAALIFGVFTKMAATLLAIVMVVAILTVHLGDIATGELAIALLGANLGLMAVGAGDWKVAKDCACCA